MFSTVPRFLGLRPKAPWAAAFQAAARLPEGLTAGDVPVALASSLTQWLSGSGALVADAGYSAAERYCLRLVFLWKIYQAFEAQGFGAQVAEEIARSVLDVVEETPGAGRPLEAAGLAMAAFPGAVLAHLKSVHDYYRAYAPTDEAILGTAGVTPAPLLLPLTSPGFMCTVALPADMDVGLARELWRQFMRENTAVRLITVGAEAAAREAAETADPIFFAPGGGQKPGRCLWAQLAGLMPDIHQWLQQQGYAHPSDARCIVLRANGNLSAVLTKTDVIDDFALSEAFFNAC
ncbi:MAG: hypothetical protein RMJ33_10415 [Saprospiraceae bacterium]|nr:hypothetical protein [Saprospiraceae bacterium]MDW8230239.1 hypothetical protein [Saprospiraceae bacterium]